MGGLYSAHCQGNICAHLLYEVSAPGAPIQPSLVQPQRSEMNEQSSILPSLQQVVAVVFQMAAASWLPVNLLPLILLLIHSAFF